MTTNHTTRRVGRRGFTLAELLVVIGLMALLGVLTVISVKKISGDAKLASATNIVTSSLSNARAYAIKNNKVVLVVFRPWWRPEEPSAPEVMQVVLAEWNGATFVASGDDIMDGFVPIQRMAVKTLPPGIRVAGPTYEAVGAPTDGQDDYWYVPTNLSAHNKNGESAGRGAALVGIMYGPDGTTLTRNSKSDSDRVFVDFNNDGLFSKGGSSTAAPDYNYNDGPEEFTDEPAIQVVPFLAVFDEADARQRYNVAAWSGTSGVNGTELYRRDVDLSEYINQFANRIHFNRYTGVIMRQGS